MPGPGPSRAEDRSEGESEYPPDQLRPRARGLVRAPPGACPSASRTGRRRGGPGPARPLLRPRSGMARPSRPAVCALSPTPTQVAVEGPRGQERLHAELEQLASGGRSGGGGRGALGPWWLGEDLLDHKAAVAVRPVVSAALGRPEARGARLPRPLHRGAHG